MQSVEERTQAAQQQLLVQVLGGGWMMQAVAAAARLGVADELAAEQPQSIESLAFGLGVRPQPLLRLMRALASIGVFAQPTPGRFALTPASRQLRAGVPGSLRDFFIAETDIPHRVAWSKLHDAVRTGRPQVEEALGLPVFDYYAANITEGETFGRAMQNLSDMAATAMLEAYYFGRARVIVDVGGGSGALLINLLRAHPSPRGIVVDLPYIEAQARANIEASGLAPRLQFVASDFFERVPAGGDLYTLKLVLHDWDDEQCARILMRVRDAIAPGGRLLVMEQLMPENNAPGLAQFSDLNMLVMTGGRERTAAEFEAVLDDGGFRMARVIPTGSPFFIVEADPT